MNDRATAFVRFLLGVLVLLGAYFVAPMFAPGQPSSLRFEIVDRPMLMLFLLAGFSFLLVTVDRVQGNPLAAMGLSVRGTWLRDVGWGLLLGTGIVALAVIVISLAGELNATVRVRSHSLLALGAVLAILAAGAMAEELMFRGYPFQRLVDATGPMGAVAVLSVLFGAAHFSNPNASIWGVLNTILVGVLLSLAYLRTLSLWMPFGIHFAWNATLGLVFGLPVSGLNTFSVIVRSRPKAPAWLTGGEYGIEASVLGTAVIVIGIILVMVFVRKRERVAEPETEQSSALGL